MSTRKPHPVPTRPGRDALLPCWCKERTGKPIAHCRDCGGSGIQPVRFPPPRDPQARED